MREIVHIQGGQCGNQIGAKVRELLGTSIRPECDASLRWTLAAAACGCNIVVVVVAVEPAQ
jgi:hypothetical protein